MYCWRRGTLMSNSANCILSDKCSGQMDFGKRKTTSLNTFCCFSLHIWFCRNSAFSKFPPQNNFITLSPSVQGAQTRNFPISSSCIELGNRRAFSRPHRLVRIKASDFDVIDLILSLLCLLRTHLKYILLTLLLFWGHGLESRLEDVFFLHKGLTHAVKYIWWVINTSMLQQS